MKLERIDCPPVEKPDKVVPRLKGLHMEYITRTLARCAALMVTAGIVFHILNKRQRKKKFAEFHRNFDANKAFDRMKDAGLIQAMTVIQAAEEKEGGDEGKK